MIGRGISGGFSVISVRIQPGAEPPGVGKTRTARPSQTKERPSVTTMEGSCQIWIMAPTPA